MAKLNKDAMDARAKGTLLERLGVEILEAGDGIARARLTIGPDHLAPNGFLHAATVVAVADSCCGYGCFADLPSGSAGFTTVELKSNHVGTVRDGTILCDARALHQGRTTQVWDATVYGEDRPDRPIALFRCTQMVLWPR